MEYAHSQAIANEAQATLMWWRRPSVLYRPRLSRDGDQWCALLGDNLQEGLAAFGTSPEGAMLAFDKAWFQAG